MANNIYQKLIANILGTRQIAFNPDLARITKSVEAGLLLSQLLYWHKKGRNPEWFYKTIAEIKEEVYLTRSQQDTAIKKCRNLGLIEIKLMGIPRKRYFKVKIERIVDLLKTIIRTDNFHRQACKKQAGSIVPFRHATTENTKKLQTENGFNKFSDPLKKYPKYEVYSK